MGMTDTKGFAKAQIENAIAYYEGVLLRCPKTARGFYQGLIAELSSRLA